MPVTEPTVPDAPPPESANKNGAKGDDKAAEISKPAAPAKTAATVSASAAPGDAAATILTYRELGGIATKLAAQLSPPDDAKVIVVSTDWSVFRQITGYQAFVAGLDELVEQCDAAMSPPEIAREGVAKPAITGQVEAITGLFKAVSDLLALFKTEVSTTAKDVQLDGDALVAALIGGMAARREGLRFLYQPWLTGSGGAIGERLARLDVKRAGIAAEHDRLDGEEDKERRARLNTMLQSIDGFKAELTGGDQGRLVDLYAAQALSEALTGDGVYVLFVKNIYGGGERLEITRTFFHRTEIYESGGAVVTYMLASREGAVLSSGNLQSHSGYVPFTSVRSTAPEH